MFSKSKILAVTGLVLCFMAISSYAQAATDDSQSATTVQPTPQSDSAAKPPAAATDESATATDSQNTRAEKQKPDAGEQPARPADSD